MVCRPSVYALTLGAVNPADIASLRVEYETNGLSRRDLGSDPFREFSAWFEAAVAAGVNQPNAFVLATATPDGTPSARAVLMKDFSSAGLVFYTNSASRKGRELAGNPRAAACFVWMELHRQVRVEGSVTRVGDDVADEYFRSRPLGSKLAAAASPQSEVVAGRSALEARLAEVSRESTDGEVSRPSAWVGFQIAPDQFEFWQGRPDRFHDRFRYRLVDGAWVIERLAP